MSEPQVSLVIPMLNEAANAPVLFDRIAPVMDKLGVPWEAVCVDDGSTDKTAEILKQIQKRIPQLVLVSFARNFGQHAAVTAGLLHARGAWIITLDADLQNPPEEIPALVEQFRLGYDVINTVRRDRQDTWFRKTASKITNGIVRKMSRIRINDFGCMLRGYSREVAQAIVSCREYQTFIPALAMLFARRPVEIQVGHAAREHGVSNYSLLRLFSLQLDLITSFSVQPLRLLFTCGMALAAIGFLIGLSILLLRVIYGDTWSNQGTLTVLGVLFFFTGGQFFAFGLLGEYIGRIYQQVRLREPFIVQSILRVGEEPEQPGLRTTTARIAATSA